MILKLRCPNIRNFIATGNETSVTASHYCYPKPFCQLVATAAAKNDVNS